MAARKRLQLAFDTIHVQDKKLVEALDTLEEYTAAAEPILQKRAEASKPFNAALKREREAFDVAEQNAIVAEREAVILEKYKDRLTDGAQIRVGGYVLAVVEYDQMDEVTHRKAFKLKKPLRIEDGVGEEDGRE